MTAMFAYECLVNLRVDESAGRPIDVLPFWGHKPPRDGSIGPACLSQWYHAPFTVEGTTYPTAEHWMMAEKARLFGDREGLAAVLAAPDPARAKTAGRKVQGFDEWAWRDARYDAVVAGNLAKFGQHADLRAFLVATGQKVLVEASPHDLIWGIGLAADHPDVHRPTAWRGLNLLGFALMDVRGRLEAGGRL
jgi:ribA/ribD-fused uncharacterized protein